MSYVKNQRIKYKSMTAGTIVGVVVGTGRDMLGDFVAYRVTSRNNPFYKLGTVDHVSADSPWLSVR